MDALWKFTLLAISVLALLSVWVHAFAQDVQRQGWWLASREHAALLLTVCQSAVESLIAMLVFSAGVICVVLALLGVPWGLGALVRALA